MASKRKSKNAPSKKKCTMIVRVVPGVDSIRYALLSAYEAKLNQVIIVDETYAKNAPIYTDEETAAILGELKKTHVQVTFCKTFDVNQIQNDIVMEMPPDCYMIKSCFDSSIQYVHENFKKYDIFPLIPITELKFSFFNGLIFLLFMFDWMRALLNRFKITQNTHIRFMVVNRRLGYPSLPKDGWVANASKHPYIDATRGGACLKPTKSGIDYFLYLCHTHSYIGMAAWTLGVIIYTLVVGFPWYNYMPIVNHFIGTVRAADGIRIAIWVIHGAFSVFLTNRYFTEIGGKRNFQWLHAVLGFILIFPLWFILIYYGGFIYKGYRPLPPPPSLISFKKPDRGKVPPSKTTQDSEKSPVVEDDEEERVESE